jgi:glutathione S-transferase
MRDVKVRLYGMEISHPAKAARLMLEHKGIEYDLVNVPAFAQAVHVRLAGFRGGTVPALRIDGRRVVGSRAIARALEELRPDPPLFPADPERRRAVEEAEEFGDRVLQPIPRRAVRWALRHDHSVRTEFLRDAKAPAPGLAAWAIAPIGWFYARREDAASTERIRRDWAELPGNLDRVDALIADGTIGGPEPNAADFQIATALRVMLAGEDFAPLIAGRPCEALARRWWPEYPREFGSVLPAEIRGQPQPAG